MVNGMDKSSAIFIAGHGGMVGSALVRKLLAEGYDNLMLKNSSELDLRNQAAVSEFFASQHPEYVFLAAARVGGIIANSTRKGEFIYDNLMIQSNVIHSAYQSGVKRLLFLGPLEASNNAYAIAKIAGITQCRAYNEQFGTKFLCAMPNNLYGPNDNFDLTNSHVLPALIRKFHEAKKSGATTVTIWGSGSPLREFMHVDDMAAACIHIMENVTGKQLYDKMGVTHINIGVGKDVTIAWLAELVRTITGYGGEIVFDASKPDGTPRKLMDVSVLNRIGFKAKISLDNGISEAYKFYLDS